MAYDIAHLRRLPMRWQGRQVAGLVVADPVRAQDLELGRQQPLDGRPIAIRHRRDPGQQRRQRILLADRGRARLRSNCDRRRGDDGQPKNDVTSAGHAFLPTMSRRS